MIVLLNPVKVEKEEFTREQELIFNPRASAILKWRFKLLRWMQYLNKPVLLISGLDFVTIIGLFRNPLR
jgi:hypothetical protein